MTYLQVVLSEPDRKVLSGADIRNDAILRALSAAGGSRRISLERAAQGASRGRRAWTVAPIAGQSIGALLEEVRASRPLAVIFEQQVLLEAIEALRAAFPALPMIVDFHNIESSLELSIRLRRLPPPVRALGRLAFGGGYRRAVAADLKAARRAGAVWTCSAADKAGLRALGFSGPVSVVPNPIPDWCLETPESLPRRESSEVALFVGHLGYAPNRRAVAELCHQIMPRLRQHVPEARLHVCGRRPHGKTAALVAASGHSLTANPPDLAPIYRAAAALVVPLREGGGTRIKILEAMAIGCPVVASAKAFEGLGLSPGVHVFPAETPDDFAAALARLMRSPESAAPVIEAARKFAWDHFGPEACNEAVRMALGATGGRDARERRPAERAPL